MIGKGGGIPYALSAKYYLHRTYAEYLTGKQRLKTKDIQRILSQVDPSEAEIFNEKYIENLYMNYMNVAYDDGEDVDRLKENIWKYRHVLILAPGSSLNTNYSKILEYVTTETCIISVNFIPDMINIQPHYVFLTNAKRYDAIKHKKNKKIKLIITSNLLRDIAEYDYAMAYNELVYFNGEYCDDSTLMLVNLLDKLGVKSVLFAGFDGKQDGKLNYFDEFYDRNNTASPDEYKIRHILNSVYKSIKKKFVTESEYQ